MQPFPVKYKAHGEGLCLVVDTRLKFYTATFRMVISVPEIKLGRRRTADITRYGTGFSTKIAA